MSIGICFPVEESHTVISKMDLSSIIDFLSYLLWRTENFKEEGIF
jgi:hypothetical protein